MNIFDKANDAIRNTESSLVNLLSAIAPWGAPLAPAYMSYGGMVKHLAYAPWVAGIIAGVIEILGLATVHTTLLFWRHNRRYTREYKQMPTLLAGGMFLLYLVIILTVNVVMEWPVTWTYTPILARALLSLLAVPAAVTLAIRSQHTELLHEMKEARSGKVLETFRKEETSRKPSSDWRHLPEEDRALIIGMKSSAIAARYNVTERTARNWKANSNGKNL